MKTKSLLIMCLLTVAALFFNAACSSKQESGYTEVDLTDNLETEEHFFHRKDPLDLEVPPKPSFSYSHKVGSTVRPGESIHITYKTENAYLEATLTLEEGGFILESNSSNLQASASTTANSVKHCWGTDNDCFIATKNNDGSWTIRSLPFK